MVQKLQSCPLNLAGGDVDQVDVISALWKRGKTLNGLGAQYGYSRTHLASVFRIPNPRLEMIVAHELGWTPQSMWPSRYNADGTSKRRPRGNPNFVSRYRRTVNGTTGAGRRHVKSAGAY